jgi:hypothetical protein
MRIYRNNGGTFTENTPIPTPNSKAVYNVATFDINGDGWRDIILGKGANVNGSASHASGSTEVWMHNGKAGLNFTYPSGRPLALARDQASTFEVQLTGTFGGVPGVIPAIAISVNGAAFSATPMTPLGGDLYEATISTQECGTSVRYYLTGVSSGNTVTDPLGAPANFYIAAASESSSSLLEEDFEGAAVGWTVQNDGSLSGGAWGLGDPNGTWYEGYRASPEDDASPAGSQAFVTGVGAPGDSVSANDVDGGPTHLISPAFDLSGGTGTISFSRWFYSNTQGDLLEVSVSNNDGASWVPVISFKPPPITNWNGPGEYTQSEWQPYSFNVSDYVTPTDQVRVRFTANDVAPAGFVEAGIDDVTVLALNCAGGPLCPADITGNGGVDIDDLLAVINSWGSLGGPADVNGSGVVDIDDLLMVINGWGSCPK